MQRKIDIALDRKPIYISAAGKNNFDDLPMNSNQDDNKTRKIDWRVLLGITLTTVWIGAGIVYLVAKVGLFNFVDLPTGDIGSFLEGAFAPLAFLWLVIGHFMQQTEISANTRAMQEQEKSSQRQELNSRRNSYFKLLELVQEQLGSIAAFHYISILGPSGTGEVSNEEYAAMRSESASDSAYFVRKMTSLIAANSQDPDKVEEFLFGTEIRTRHSQNFETTFEKILNNAKTIDQDDMLSNAILYGSSWGIFYRVIRTAQGKEDIDPLSGFTTKQSQPK